MSPRPDADRLLEDWLADGPSQLSDRVIDGIVRQLDETQQRKHWWLPRRNDMNRLVFALGGAAAAVVLAVVGLGFFGGLPGIGGPQATPSPTPIVTQQAPSPAATRFVSERHGYSLLLPDESWLVAEHAGSWEGLGSLYDHDTQGVDRPLSFNHPDWMILINGQSVPPEMTFDEWLEIHRQAMSALPTECSALESATRVVSGRAARSFLWECRERRDTDEARAWRQADAYIFGAGVIHRVSVLPEVDRPDMDPLAVLDEWLDRLELVD